MGATNKTPNIELPQFVGTDKPSWLGDFNGAMNTIDVFAGKTTGDIGTVTATANAAKSAADAAGASVTALETTVAQHTTEISDTMADVSSLEADVQRLSNSIEGATKVTSITLDYYSYANNWSKVENFTLITIGNKQLLAGIPSPYTAIFNGGNGLVGAFRGNPLNLPPVTTALCTGRLISMPAFNFHTSQVGDIQLLFSYISAQNATYITCGSTILTMSQNTTYRILDTVGVLPVGMANNSFNVSALPAFNPPS